MATSSLSQGRSWAKARARSRRRRSGPARSSAIQSPSGTRTPEVVPFQVKTTSCDRVDLRRGRAARHKGACSTSASSFSCLTDVGHPAFAEALPGEHGDRPRAEHRPHRHLDRAGVGAGDDADQVAVGDAQHLAGQLDRVAEPRLAELRAVRAAERAEWRDFRGPSPAASRRGRKRNKAAGRVSGRSARSARRLRLVQSCTTLLTESPRRVGTAWPAEPL